MKRYLHFGLLLLVAIAATRPVRAGEVIDRIIALVNGQPVLLSQWQDRIRYDAMLEGRSLPDITPEQEQDALQQTIDQELVEQQIRGRNLPAPGEDEIKRRLVQLREQILVTSSADHEDDWHAVLERYGLNEAQVEAMLGAQIRMLHFVNAEILPGVHVENRSVLAYYRDNLLPRLQESGKPAPPLEEVADQIRDILLQERAGALLQEWLHSLRTQSDVRMLVPRTPPATSSPENTPNSARTQ